MASVTHDVRASLLRGLFDDASLFPPASLSVPDAIEANHTNKHGRYHALQGRFVFPARLTDELLRAYDPRHGGLLLSVVVEAEALATERASLRRLLDALPQVTIEAFELRLPGEQHDVDQLIAWTHAMQEFARSKTIEIYVESPFSGDWTIQPETLARVIATARERTDNDGLSAKLRLGGSVAEAFPSPPQVAGYLLAMRDAEVALKATAGLHHAYRGEHGGFVNHGFINILAAALLAHARVIPDQAVAEVVAERDPGAFVLEERRFGWGGSTIGSDAVHTARESMLRSIGSCSFEEPVEELRHAGVLQ